MKELLEAFRHILGCSNHMWKNICKTAVSFTWKLHLPDLWTKYVLVTDEIGAKIMQNPCQIDVCSSVSSTMKSSSNSTERRGSSTLWLTCCLKMSQWKLRKQSSIWAAARKHRFWTKHQFLTKLVWTERVGPTKWLLRIHCKKKKTLRMWPWQSFQMSLPPFAIVHSRATNWAWSFWSWRSPSWTWSQRKGVSRDAKWWAQQGNILAHPSIYSLGQGKMGVCYINQCGETQ